MEKLTFCVSTHNNLNYLKLAVASVRKYSYFKTAPFIIHAENCDDGTDEWLRDNQAALSLQVIIDHNEQPVGIGGGMNVCAKQVNTEYIMFLHSDFVVSTNWDLNCMNVFSKYPHERLWVSSYQIQPNIFNEQSIPGKIIVDLDEFGEYYSNFNEDTFITFVHEFVKLNTDLSYDIGQGVSGLIKKADWDYIGGNDPLFAPASYDDVDLFMRMTIEGYKLVTIAESVVYHFGARGSHFPNDNLAVKHIRQATSEARNLLKFYAKWCTLPWLKAGVGYKITPELMERYRLLRLLNQHNNFIHNFNA